MIRILLLKNSHDYNFHVYLKLCKLDQCAFLVAQTWNNYFLLVFKLKANHCDLPSESFRDAVNSITIQHTCKKIERHSGTETATRSNGRKSANEIHALHVEQSVEIVILRYEDLVAIRILQVWRPVAAFFRVVSVQGICESDDQYIMIARSYYAHFIHIPHAANRRNISFCD